MAQIFPDSKTFVDMKLKAKPAETLEKFRELQNQTDYAPTKEQIKEFVEANFEEPGQEFEAWTPNDWHDNPKFVADIKDENLKEFALGLNHLWLDLGRKMKDSVKEHEDLYSIIYVPNPVIVPGGRFREFYYWDSYWIIKGLLLSEMKDVSLLFDWHWEVGEFDCVYSSSSDGARNAGELFGDRSAVRIHTERRPYLLRQSFAAPAAVDDDARVLQLAGLQRVHAPEH